MQWPPWSKNGRTFPKWWLIVAATLAVVALFFGYPILSLSVIGSLTLLLVGIAYTRRSLIRRDERWRRDVGIGVLMTSLGTVVAFVAIWNLILAVTQFFF